jgi:hypothetical protein
MPAVKLFSNYTVVLLCPRPSVGGGINVMAYAYVSVNNSFLSIIGQTPGSIDLMFL